MSQQPVGVTPEPSLPALEHSSTLDQETIPTTSAAEPTIGSQTNTVTLQGSSLSSEPTPEATLLLSPVTEQSSTLNEGTRPTIIESAKPSQTNTLTPGVPPPPEKSSSSPAVDDGYRQYDGYLKFLNPTRDFLYGKRDRRPALVWFGLIVLVALSMGVSVGSNSRGIEPLAKHPCNKTGVGIVGQTLKFDSPGTQQLTVRWSIIGCGKYALGGTLSRDDYALPNLAVDVYLNNASDPAFSYDPDSLPGHVQLPSGRQGGLPPLDLVSFENDYRVITGEQYKTPLDRYDFTAFVFVINPATNFSVPVVSFEVGDTGLGDFITTCETGTSRSNFTYEPPNLNTTVSVTIPSYTTYATVRRTIRAQALTFLMFTINWLLTLCTLAITGIVANKREVKDGVALLPVSIILSVPAIRSLYIGSPPFGIFFDVVGFFPQMIIVVACAMIVLFISVMDNPDATARFLGNTDLANIDLANISAGQGDPEKGGIDKVGTGEKVGVLPGFP